jgi:hypothetical protein
MVQLPKWQVYALKKLALCLSHATVAAKADAIAC